MNILLGINGSGKSNFLKAIDLLYEIIAGNGLENIFLKKWSGFAPVANFNSDTKDYIKLSFEFNKDAINKNNRIRGFQFQTNPIYDLTMGFQRYPQESQQVYFKSTEPVLSQISGRDFILFLP